MPEQSADSQPLYVLGVSLLLSLVKEVKICVCLSAAVAREGGKDSEI